MYCTFTLNLISIIAILCPQVHLRDIRHYENQYYEYIRIDMIVNQDKLFSIYVTILRTIWTQTRTNLADLRVLSLSLD